MSDKKDNEVGAALGEEGRRKLLKNWELVVLVWRLLLGLRLS
jgi:hypothetical protein